MSFVYGVLKFMLDRYTVAF